jgi:hypothetical protein
MQIVNAEYYLIFPTLITLLGYLHWQLYVLQNVQNLQDKGTHFKFLYGKV